MNEAGSRQYDTLVRVLDGIRSEAPPALQIYHVKDSQGVIQARSRAFIHLFLKARFGKTSFNEREKLITDGAHDGGIDAYMIDRSTRRVHVIQSKFRATAGNFSGANLSSDDIVKMDVGRVVKGEKRDERGAPYNDKIQRFQAEIRKIPDIASYTHSVTILGNSKHLGAAVLRRLVGGYDVEQFDYERAYVDLLFPVINGTYFSDPNLLIEIQRKGRGSDSHLDYDVVVGGIGVNVKLLYVPTQEIARVMHTYKNSILSYNPRSFLQVAKNPVNKEILASLESDRSNEFSLFNNGVTIVSDETALSTNTGKVGLTQLMMRSPQLINGAQTAYSLSLAYAKGRMEAFKNKEVLLRVITFRHPKGSAVPTQREQLIARISRASNLQTRVDEADRRSNDPLQLSLQRAFFNNFGLYYERKRGEFNEGLADGYISPNLLVNRERLLRVALAAAGNISQARASIDKYFKKDEFEKTLKVAEVGKYAFGYEALNVLRSFPKGRVSKYREDEFGHALRYGMYAVVGVCISRLMSGSPKDASAAVKVALGQWRTFEKWAARRVANRAYLKDGVLDAVNYYKGTTINADLKAYNFRKASRRGAK